MSSEEGYFPISLAVLRSGRSALEALRNALGYGIVSAGTAYRATRDKAESSLDESFGKLLEDAHEDCKHGKRSEGMDEVLWENALVGAKLVRCSWTDPGYNVLAYQANHSPGEVFFKIRADWMRNAYAQALRDAGHNCPTDKPLSWVEFRILAALLSGKVNSYDFTFQSWETIQARACGFHSKELFQAGRDALPDHCKPLTRDVIRRRLDRMEGLRFFARCLYSTGSRGGLTAYSFRHPNRRKLIDAVLEWKKNHTNLMEIAQGHRLQDMDVFRSQLKPVPQTTGGPGRPGKAPRAAAPKTTGQTEAPVPPAGSAAPAHARPGAAVSDGPEPSFLTKTRGPQNNITSVGDALAQLFADNEQRRAAGHF